ncbi:hypothetical protein [Methylobacterium dankookense]|uniref:Uncharacterized protein n=1 Tax=Methylobacterium dankookense TaxID=560405 RepID=A0A564G3W2_9HYPH|nr:hypothetical protein [Methylobacterium dankookense]GJD58678.1 hypothetical protein IFDJLNFL_4601 [Methylobacterium dankookense]VUF15193.1 hypothetical protein MTDSW087_04928 [Methylobacterium dankookense]
MTCIVGLEHEGRVYIGGDSAGVDSRYALTVRADEKVFARDGVVMGFTSSFRMGQLLHYALVLPRQAEGQDDMEFMVTTFMDAVRTCLKAGGYTKVENAVEEGGTFLIGRKGRLYTIQDDFQVARASLRFDAVGCGDLIALGALWANEKSEGIHTPEGRVQHALMAAEQMSAGVRGPFKIVSA